MQSQFKNLQQLLDFFKDEETCKAYYEKARWNGNVTCPHCGHEKVYRTTRGFKCANKECYKKFSVTVGTIFENSKVPLRIWFAAMFLISTAKKGISSIQLSIQLGVTQKTAWFLLHRIREMLKDNSTNTEPLNGMVEVDETYVGGKNKNRHKDKKVPNSQGRASKDKTPVVGLVERGGKVLTFVAESTDAETLHQIIDNNCSNEAIGLSKKWAASCFLPFLCVPPYRADFIYSTLRRLAYLFRRPLHYSPYFCSSRLFEIWDSQEGMGNGHCPHPTKKAAQWRPLKIFSYRKV